MRRSTRIPACGSWPSFAPTRVALAVGLGQGIMVLSACTLGLLDLVAYQVLSSEKVVLYLGYRDSGTNGYGVARLGTTTGAIDVFRETLAEANTNGCSLCMDPWATFPKSPADSSPSSVSSRIPRLRRTHEGRTGTDFGHAGAGLSSPHRSERLLHLSALSERADRGPTRRRQRLPSPSRSSRSLLA